MTESGADPMSSRVARSGSENVTETYTNQGVDDIIRAIGKPLSERTVEIEFYDDEDEAVVYVSVPRKFALKTKLDREALLLQFELASPGRLAGRDSYEQARKIETAATELLKALDAPKRRILGYLEQTSPLQLLGEYARSSEHHHLTATNHHSRHIVTGRQSLYDAVLGVRRIRAWAKRVKYKLGPHRGDKVPIEQRKEGHPALDAWICALASIYREIFEGKATANWRHATDTSPGSYSGPFLRFVVAAIEPFSVNAKTKEEQALGSRIARLQKANRFRSD